MADLLSLNAQTLNPGIINSGRLSLLTGVPVPDTDLIGITNLRFTPGAPPFYGDRIAIPDPVLGRYPVYQFAEKTLVLAGLTSGKNYDVFAYEKTSNVAIDLAPAWTNDTTRAQAVSLVNGIPVNTLGFTSLIAGDTVAATAGRHLGTIRATGATTTESSKAKRFLWNRYNQVPRAVRRVDPASSWTYNSATFRQANANAANQVEVVVGELGCPIDLTIYAIGDNNADSVSLVVAVGEDALTPEADAIYVRSANNAGSITLANVSIARLSKAVPLGYHAYLWLEASTAAFSTTMYGTSGATPVSFKSGMVGHVLA